MPDKVAEFADWYRLRLYSLAASQATQTDGGFIMPSRPKGGAATMGVTVLARETARDTMALRDGFQTKRSLAPPSRGGHTFVLHHPCQPAGEETDRMERFNRLVLDDILTNPNATIPKGLEEIVYRIGTGGSLSTASQAWLRYSKDTFDKSNSSFLRDARSDMLDIQALCGKWGVALEVQSNRYTGFEPLVGGMLAPLTLTGSGWEVINYVPRASADWKTKWLLNDNEPGDGTGNAPVCPNFTLTINLTPSHEPPELGGQPAYSEKFDVGSARDLAIKLAPVYPYVKQYADNHPDGWTDKTQPITVNFAAGKNRAEIVEAFKEVLDKACSARGVEMSEAFTITEQ